MLTAGVQNQMAHNDEQEKDAPLLRTPLHDLHVAAGAKMVPFAGYEMPVSYPLGVLGEHLHTRAQAGLFDVSHMGQAILSSDNPVAPQIESLVPGDIAALEVGNTRYTQLLNDEGGIRDDLMVTRIPDAGGRERLFLVVNAACKEADFAHIGGSLKGAKLELLEDRALIALQGPVAFKVLERIIPGCADMAFMSWRSVTWNSAELFVTRSGYTGEDGYEISVPADDAVSFTEHLLNDEAVAWIGLGARDSLRLESGLCLYGHDIDETTSPIEAKLAWSISKRRRAEGGFPGAERIQRELRDGATRKRVGILPEGPAPAREGTIVHAAGGEEIGVITSGGFGPSFGGPVAMGYVASEYAATGTKLDLMVRGKARPATVAAMPFVPANFYRGK